MNAVLIMCHKNPHQVVRLAKRCVSNESDVIIHADVDMPDSDYAKLKNSLENIKGVFFTKNRLHGVLDDRSLVDIAMEMIARAYEISSADNKTYKYYLLLSGQDYPIIPIDRINKYLRDSYPTPYIDCTPYSKNNWIYHKFKGNHTIYRYRDWIRKKFVRKSIIRKAFSLSLILSYYLAKFGSKTDYHKLTKMKVSLYGGSAWWILPDVAIEKIYDEYLHSTREVLALLTTMTPEETFFQTMTMRTDVADLVVINEEQAREQNCKTYAYFCDEGKEFVGHPYIITIDNYQKIMRTDCWFARKFDEDIDSEVLNVIDDNCHVRAGENVL